MAYQREIAAAAPDLVPQQFRYELSVQDTSVPSVRAKRAGSIEGTARTVCRLASLVGFAGLTGLVGCVEGDADDDSDQ